MAFAISVPTALLPVGFSAPPEILAELQPNYSLQVQERSAYIRNRTLNNILCTSTDGTTAP